MQRIQQRESTRVHGLQYFVWKQEQSILISGCVHLHSCEICDDVNNAQIAYEPTSHPLLHCVSYETEELHLQVHP
jgi:hypothetical protein